tara:strand:- start:384 stop:731 length:348 start_codon:yes stop_codon:yes gene_type:complete
MIIDSLKTTYVFDIDGTLCTLSSGVYEDAKPIIDRVAKVNELYDSGHTIILNTARGMGRTKNNALLAEKLFRELTEKQLDDWGVKYHKLFMGKPSGDIYIDDKGEKDEDFFNTKN